ncbi:MAG: hypothetical protein METHP_01491 [Methanoregula sp. SKADARSKE-2]|nr:MAG: hypothetical protein METHP_01491 [Methanoregula sp. SKADARSKE-2]
MTPTDREEETPQEESVVKNTLFSQKKGTDYSTLGAVLSSIPSPPITRTKDLARLHVDETLFDDAIQFALTRPQVSAHAPIASAMLEYLSRTVPHFNKSEFGATALEDALKTTYPELWARFFAHAMVEPRWKNTVKRHQTPRRKNRNI